MTKLEENHRKTFSMTSLQAERGSRRRELFSGIRRVIVGAGTAAVAFRGTKGLPVFAEENDARGAGNTIEIQVANLDGNPGGTGTIKIMMRPDWAPRGVARFEVRNTSGMWLTVSGTLLIISNLTETFVSRTLCTTKGTCIARLLR